MKLKYTSLITCSLLGLHSIAHSQDIYTYIGAGGSAWLRSSNWTGGVLNKMPGVDANPATIVDGAITDIALIATRTNVTSIGINFNVNANNGNSTNGAANQSLSLGAINVTAGNSSTPAMSIGNSSNTLFGVLTLNGVTVEGDSNVILKNSSAGLFTIQNFQGGNRTMDVALGNAVDNVIRIAGNGGISISSIISGATRNLTLNANGTGALTLGAANSYTGTTNVTAGSLFVTGSTAAASAVTINTGLLGGNGTVAGTVSIKSGAVLSPGATPSAIGTLTTGAVTVETGSIFSWQVATAGTTFDKLNTSATSISGSGGTFSVVVPDALANAFWNTPQSFTTVVSDVDGATPIINWTNAFSTLTVVDSTLSPVDVSARGGFSLGGNTVTWTPVPEPSSVLAGLLLGAGLLRRKRADAVL